MAPLLRSRRTSPRLLAFSATTLAKPNRHEAIDFRTRQHFRGRLRCPPHLRANKTSKRGKRARFLITIMLFDHFVAIYSYSQHQCSNRCPTNCFTHHQSAHPTRSTHGSTSHDQPYPCCWAGACSGYHPNPCCWAGACSGTFTFLNWTFNRTPNRIRTTILTRAYSTI